MRPAPAKAQGATFRVRLPLMIVQPEQLDVRREHPRTGRREPLARLGDLTRRPRAGGRRRRGCLDAAADGARDGRSRGRDGRVAGPGPGAPRQSHPHVLVVDLGMPEMDGFELIARIRASPDPRVRDLPAAALTAFARSEDRTKALRERLRDASGQAGRSGRARGLGRDARPARARVARHPRRSTEPFRRPPKNSLACQVRHLHLQGTRRAVQPARRVLLYWRYSMSCSFARACILAASSASLLLMPAVTTAAPALARPP